MDNWMLFELEKRIRAETLLAWEGTIGIYFEDLRKGGTISVNQDVIFPAASTIKVPVMAYIMWAAEHGEIRLDDTVRLDLSLPKFYQEEGSGILTHLSSSLSLNIRDLVTLMIVTSDNIATNVLIDIVGFSSVNHFLEQLGMRITRVTDYIEDFEALRASDRNPSTPREMAYLLKLMYQGKLPESSLMVEILKKQFFASRLPLFISDDENLTIAHKTGTLDGIVHDVGLVMHSCFDYVLTVMTEGYRSKLFAELLIAKLSALVYHHLMKGC